MRTDDWFGNESLYLREHDDQMPAAGRSRSASDPPVCIGIVV